MLYVCVKGEKNNRSLEQPVLAGVQCAADPDDGMVSEHTVALGSTGHVFILLLYDSFHRNSPVHVKVSVFVQNSPKPHQHPQNWQVTQAA